MPSCTRRRSTSAGTPTRSAARWSCATRAARARALRAERRRRRARPARLLPRAPRAADAAPAHGGARRERAWPWALAARAAGRRRRALARVLGHGRASATPRRRAIVAATRLFALAESLGGVESLVEVPQAMTHQSVEGSAAAVPADLVRLCCGVEAAVDLVEDLRQALRRRYPRKAPLLRIELVLAPAHDVRRELAAPPQLLGCSRWASITDADHAQVGSPCDPRWRGPWRSASKRAAKRWCSGSGDMPRMRSTVSSRVHSTSCEPHRAESSATHAASSRALFSSTSAHRRRARRGAQAHGADRQRGGPAPPG